MMMTILFFYLLFLVSCRVGGGATDAAGVRTNPADGATHTFSF
jgi:hypothetical protein